LAGPTIDRLKLLTLLTSATKTRKLVNIPLYDEDGTMLWPELVARLDAAPRYGTLIVTRDQPDRRRKVHLPWKVDYFRHRVASKSCRGWN
jgi:hypothetical protein